jgi:hypothetical protein
MPGAIAWSHNHFTATQCWCLLALLQIAAGRVAALKAMQQELNQAATAAFPAEANTYK